PPPEITSQRICAPSTPRPFPSATVTRRGPGRGCPATPDCLSPERIARPGGRGPSGSPQLPSMTVLSSIPTKESGRRLVIRGENSCTASQARVTRTYLSLSVYGSSPMRKPLLSRPTWRPPAADRAPLAMLPFALMSAQVRAGCTLGSDQRRCCHLHTDLGPRVTGAVGSRASTQSPGLGG